ncbi:MAG: tetratricopeptide repeat protein [Magnetococcus sp. DMHC-8]
MNAAVEQWRQRFAHDPPQAVGDLLGGRVYLGAINRAEPPEALQYALADLGHAGQQRLDDALLAWLKQARQADHAAQLGYDNPKAFARMLMHGFHTAATMDLPQTLRWMEDGCAWREWQTFLGEYFFGQSCDPLGTYYTALGSRQQDRRLLRLWLEVAALSRGGFSHYGRMGLDGLLRMPEQDGSAPAGRVSESLLVGLLHFARGLSRLQRTSDELDRYVAFLQGAYPMSADAWTRKLGEARQRVPLDETATQWLQRHFPAAFAEHETARSGPGALRPPSKPEWDNMYRRLKSEPLTTLRADLVPFLDRYRQYTEGTGDSNLLVRSFNSVGNAILDKPDGTDPVWVAELAQEAATWEPYNAYSWPLLGRALDDAGDWRRAEAVFWQARRRFPHNVLLHNQLGEALARRGETGAALAVLDEAIRFFPDDVVNRVSKAYALLWAGKTEEALATLEHAVRLSPNDMAAQVGKASLLMQRGRLDEAGQALEQARAIDPKSSELFKKERDLQRLRQGHSMDFHLKPRPTGRDGSPDTLAEITGQDISHAPSLGRATAFRRTGNSGVARANLEQVGHPIERRSEEGLLIWWEKGEAEAADYFDAQLEHHPGDGTLRLHHGRACQRSNRASVDWNQLRARFPEMEAVILTEKNNGKAPRYPVPAGTDNRTDTHEDRKHAWFMQTLDRDGALLDPAEEELIAACRA